MNILKKSFYSLILTAFALLISGCMGSNQPEPEAKIVPIPNWYINAPSSNHINLYGVGQGDTIDEAKNNALNSISSRLLVNIDSTLETTKTTSNDSYSKQSKQNIKVAVEKIQYTNTKVEKNILIDDKYYLLVKVSRTKLFDENKKEFDLIDNKLEKKYASLSRKSVFTKIVKLGEMKKDIQINEKKAFVLYAIDNDFNYASYLKKYSSYLNEIDELKDSMKIKVTSNNNKHYFLDELTDLININKYTVSTSSNSDIKIQIRNKVRYSRTRGWIIAKVSTTLSVYQNNKIFSNKIIKSIGRSTSNKENALADASVSFSEDIKELTLDNILYYK